MKLTRRRRGYVAGLVLGSLGLAVASTAFADDPDTNLVAARTQLLSLADSIDRIAAIPQLQQVVPLSELNPAGGSGLGLGTLLRDAFDELPSESTGLTQFVEQLEAVAAPGGSPVSFYLGCPTSDPCATHVVGAPLAGGAIGSRLTIPIKATRQVTAPFAVDTADDSFTLDDGGLTADLAFDLTLVLELDYTKVLDPATFISVIPPSAGSFSVALAGAAPAFTSTFGFTSVSATATGTGGYAVPFALVDPDGSGRTTAGELAASDIADVFDPGTSTSDFDATIALDSDLTGTGTDLTATFDGIGVEPVLSGPGLAAFSKITPDQAIAGIAQLASTFQGVTSAADIRLPLLQEGLASITSAAQPLLDFFAANAVQCGPADPTGDEGPLQLVVGMLVFCQALAVRPASQISAINWGGPGATVVELGTDAGTVSTSPTTRVKYQITNPDTFDPTVTYTVTAPGKPGVVMKATRAPLTAQALRDKLAPLFPGLAPASLLTYDSASQSLLFRLKKMVDPAALDVRVDVGDTLSEAGITGAGDVGGSTVPESGVLPPGSAKLSVNPGEVTTDLTFGMVLVPDAAQINRAGQADYPAAVPVGEADRFFLKVPASEPVLSLSDIAATGSFALNARIGFLGLELATQAGEPFQLTKPLAGPALALSVDLPGFSVDTNDDGTDDAPIADAVQLRNLSSVNLVPGATGSDLDTVVNLAASLGLEASASVGGTTLGTATLDVAVPDAKALATAVDPAAVAAAIDVTPDLQFGELFRDFTNVGALANDPQQLFSVLVTLLDSLASSIDVLGGPFDTPLPLIGKSPKDLLAQVKQLQQSVRELSGAPSTVVNCGNAYDAVTNALTGDATQPDVDGRVYCRATATKVATGDVVWKALVAGSASPLPPVGPLSPAELVATVGPDPTKVVTFEVGAGNYLAGTPPPTGPGTHNAYSFSLSFADTDGPHQVSLPSDATPSTLQGFVDRLVQRLGLPTGAITASVGNIKKDGTGPDLRSLVLGLNLGICTFDRDALDELDPAACADSDRVIAQADTPKAPLAFSLGSAGGLASVSSAGDIALSFRAALEVGVAVPLSDNPTPLVLDGSKVVLDLGADSTTLSLDASLGPFQASLGTAVGTVPNGDGVGGTKPAEGVLHAGFGFEIGKAGTATNGSTVTDFIADLTAEPLAGSADNDCGTVNKSDGTPYDFVPGESVLDDAVACVRLAASIEGYVGDIGARLTTAGGSLQIATPPDLLTLLASRILDPAFLLEAFRELVADVAEALKGAGKDVEVPILGDALDAGADVAGTLESAIADLQAALQTIQDTLKPAPANPGDPPPASDYDSANDVRDAVQSAVFSALGPDGADILRVDDASDTAGALAQVAVIARCGSNDPCLDGDSPVSLSDLELRLTLGKGKLGGDCTSDACEANLPFDIGLDGLPIRLSGALDASVGWRVHTILGLSRQTGPYLGTNPTVKADGTGGPAKELAVEASVELGDSASNCGPGATPAGYSAARCLEGTLGFLQVNVRDGDGPAGPTAKSEVGISASLDVTGSGTEPNRLGVQDFLSGAAGAAFALSGNALFNVSFRTGFREDENAGFPSVLGKIRLGFDSPLSLTVDSNGAVTNLPTFVADFSGLQLDIGKFGSEFLNPITEQIKKVTSPLKPVIDTLQAPLPVLTQLAALVGEPPVTLLSLIQAISGQDLRLIQSLLSIIKLANEGLSDTPGVIDLGAFAVDTAMAKSGAVAPNDAGKLIKAGSELGLPATLTIPGNSSTPNTPALSSAADDGRPTTFGVKGLDVPFLKSPGEIFKLLMGQDITLISYDAGTLQATAGTSISFGPFFIGPVPVTVFIGGSATVKGRFGLGYDTSGIRKVLDGASGEHLLDGLYLFDHYNGVDLPEITLIGRVFAGAKVDIFVASAGVEGGIELTVDLNLNDSPTNDGKLYIEELIARLQNPICLFDVSGALDAFLNFFLEINLFITSKKFTFEIIRVRLLDFSSSCSNTPDPVLGTYGGGDGETLNLTVGANAANRDFMEEEENEKYIVRQTGPDSVDVTAFGFTKSYDDVARIYASAGSGVDVIQLLPGGTAGTEDDPSKEIPFLLPADLRGGPGKDKLIGGNGPNTLYGSEDGDTIPGDKPDDDTLTGGSASDTIYGGRGSDAIEGGPSDDVLYGDSATAVTELDGADRINGGGGADKVNAGPGDDAVAGGPGLVVMGTPTSAQVPLVDAGDTIIGGNGSDTLSGVSGDDVIYGGVPAGVANANPNDATYREQATIDSTCANEPAVDETQSDQITGGDGNDTLIGGPGRDEITGDGGDDRLCGLTGRDGLDGDGPRGVTPKPTSPDGKDTVEGGSQDDRITGGGDNDYLTGSAGNDRVLGGPGQDDVLGDVGRDHLEGGDGNDIVIGDTSTITETKAADISHTGTGTQLATKVTQASSDEPTSGPAQCVAALTGAEDGYQPALGGLLGDCLIGGAGNDALFGDGGSDRVLGEAGLDYVDGGNQGDVLFGGLDADVMFGRAGADDMQGDSGNDEMYGGTEDDIARGGPDDDLVYGQQADDDLFGDGGFDRLIGGDALDGTPDGKDDIVGGTGNDVVLGDNGTIASPSGDATMPASSPAGSFDNDTITGDTGDDRIYGQLGNDTITGNAGFDHVFGDMGGLVVSDPLVIEPGGGTRYTATLVAPDAGGIDTIRAGTQDDVVYGGAADDVISGNAGDDHLEGNGGKDTIYGLSADAPSTEDLNAIAFTVAQAVSNLRYTSGDDDDIIGGSSSVHPTPARADDGETEVHGNLGSDVILGDNGEINRAVADGYWAYDPIFIGPERTTDVTVDEGKTGATLDLVSGPDTLHGDELNDVVLGQGDDDLIFGEVGDDLLVGNEDQDTVRGQDGEDDVIGGSLVATQADAGVDTTDPVDDALFGDAGNDVIAGDNASITRDALPGTGLWAPDLLNGGHLRTVTLHNTRTDAVERAARSGNDVISGGLGNDLAFGEGSDDAIHGDAGDDRLLGNQDADTIDGDGGQDDLTGGSAIDTDFDAGDILRGDTEQDVAAGDNAVITRVAAGDGTWLADPIFGGSARTVELLDTEKRAPALTAYAGEDLVLGGDEQDRLFGQADNDTVKGNRDTDFVQGNQDDDLLEGNRGTDLLIGGSEVSGQPDGNDTIHGGGEADVAIGDNGLVDRPAKPDTSYYYTTYQLGVPQTFVKLHDIDVDDPTLSGNDTFSGGQGVDVGFGQAKRDYLMGGTEDDYLEGNGGSDFLWGDVVRSDIVTQKPAQMVENFPDLPANLPEGESDNLADEYALVGPPGTDGQDDEIGGSSKAGLLDDGDFLYGNGAADFQLGDNGKLQRTFVPDLTAYTTYTTYNTTTVQRRADRWNVNGSASLNGPDYVEGNDGDDYQWGQEDGDELYGNAGNDDMYGELGKDTMFGGAGEDAMLGDRGGIVDTKLTAAGAAANKTTQGPTFFDYQGLWQGQLDRRVDLFRDHTTPDGQTMAQNGHDNGDTDYMRGGSGHDSMHGGRGDDLMNGDSGGDYLFGDDGRDVMWGGVGKSGEAYSNTNPSRHLTAADSDHPDFAQGIGKDSLVDILFGGLSGTTEAVADVMDYRPRPDSGLNGCTTAGTEFSDPCSWFDLTGLRPMTTTAAGTPLLGTEVQQANQHHQGIDWQYGGEGRDVLQGDVGKNGPDFGDRLLDWVGAFNLFTRCNASYGDDGDVRQHSPDTQSFLQTLAWGSGVGGSVGQVDTSGTSAYRELAFVFAGDKNNNGKAFATTPGHYDQPSCLE